MHVTAPARALLGACLLALCSAGYAALERMPTTHPGLTQDGLPRVPNDRMSARRLDWNGMPILSSEDVSPFALAEAHALLTRMAGHRPEIGATLGAAGVRLRVMGVREMTTDVSEHSDLTPRSYWDRRARGLGATPWRPAVSCGEENLLACDGDPYGTESILIHEFAHAIHEMALSKLDPAFDARLRCAFEAAIGAGRWAGTYAATNPAEYWAEGTQSWFGANRQHDGQHNHVDTPEELRAHDPALGALLAEVYGPRPWRWTHVTQRSGDPHMAGWDPSTRPCFRWPDAVTRAWELEGRHHDSR